MVRGRSGGATVKWAQREQYSITCVMLLNLGGLHSGNEDPKRVCKQDIPTPRCGRHKKGGNDPDVAASTAL
jgi:hypothetical protein